MFSRWLDERGISTLYVEAEHEDAYQQYIEENIKEIVSSGEVSRKKASKIIYATSRCVMKDVFDSPRSGENIERVERTVEASVTNILKDPDALWDMTSLVGHDYYTYSHCVNVSLFLVAGCKEMLGITDTRVLQEVGLGGMLHDIGKSVIPDSILNKPGKLTDEEFDVIRGHPTQGAELVRENRDLPERAESIILQHHERCDGSGYPAGLTAEKLDEISRLASIVDVYDAITTKRSYAPAMAPVKALKVMLQEMSGHFDEAILRSFVAFLGGA
jgi:putative nucleotidyltransferase with HDIG domain